MLSRIGADSSTASMALAKALAQIASSARSSEVEVAGIEKISNKDLRDKVLAFTSDMRSFASADEKQTADEALQSMSKVNQTTDPEKRTQLFQAERQAMVNAAIDRNNQVTQKYVALATVYKDELIRRLGPQPPVPENMFLWYGEGARDTSDFALKDTASRLDYLARKLAP